ncbi:class I adenylate-forming enzyme family protein [Massilia sp. METH4]|uniref:class I adenylate-forming enzyme family protein n=1 Tax=Massilia sp. METH4 TaxID=3123041 RepID=UPI0030D24C2F
MSINDSRVAPPFFAHAAAHPDKLAIWCDGRTATYAGLSALVRRWSYALAERGVQPGEQIGVLLPNSIEFAALLVVAADLGASLVPLNTSLTPDAVRRAFAATEVRHLVAGAGQLEALAEGSAQPAVPGLQVSVDAAVPGAVTLDELIAAVAADVPPRDLGKPEHALILTMTSGSTGDPKPIVLPQRTKVNRAAAAVEMYGVHADDVILAATPLYHSLAERLVLMAFMHGATSVVMARFSTAAWLRCVAQQRVTFTIAVSSQLRQIVTELRTPGSHDLTSLRCVVSSSAALDNATKDELLARMDCAFHECYGTSEIAIASNLDSSSAAGKLASVGCPAPGVDIRILGPGDVELPPGADGEIVCKTPMLFGGYYHRPDLTAAAMWGEYFRTGDLGCLDEDGFLYYRGRAKDLIITGGVNVYPVDVEAVVATLPTIKECAAFAVADERLGEVVGVALVCEDPAAFNLRALRMLCAERLADFQQPRHYFVVEALPKNPMGKIMKFELVRQFGKSATAAAQ